MTTGRINQVAFLNDVVAARVARNAFVLSLRGAKGIQAESLARGDNFDRAKRVKRDRLELKAPCPRGGPNPRARAIDRVPRPRL